MLLATEPLNVFADCCSYSFEVFNLKGKHLNVTFHGVKAILRRFRSSYPRPSPYPSDKASVCISVSLEISDVETRGDDNTKYP